MAERTGRAVLLLWTLALVGLALDQATKYTVFHWLSGGEGRAHVLFGSEESGFKLIAQFEPDGSGGWKPHVNHGALFGMLRHWESWANTGFAAISLLAALAIAYWSTQPATAGDAWLCAALGLILAGTTGNLYDRVVFHGVRDFLHWNFLFDWPVFNVADCCLVIGAGLLLMQAFTSAASPTPGQGNTDSQHAREPANLKSMSQAIASSAPKF